MSGTLLKIDVSVDFYYSSQLDMLEYDSEQRILLVTFISGDQYEYDNVSRAVLGALVASESPGKAFSELIRDKYTFRKL